MIYPILTYSRNFGDFPHDLTELHTCGLKAIRLIYKGKSEDEFNARIQEIQEKISTEKLDLDILIDLPGKKPGVGNLPQGLAVKVGYEYHLVDHAVEFPFPVIPTVNFFDHDHFPDLSPGDIISIADGELNMLVKTVNETVVCEALNSFQLTSNRSMNLKNNPFPVAANSEADLLFVQNLQNVPSNVKLVVSFTEKASDLLKLKALQPGIDLIPKIETILDDASLLEIMACCETLMLGRGDLSLACKPNELFAFQERLIDLCQQNRKKLIIGTGLLTSISDKQSPTIAEVMDYSHLRSRGIDAFLIAGSNALNYPGETLGFMREFGEWS
ncbi:MAG: pyruvate kinase [Bacteroidota bacterium]